MEAATGKPYKVSTQAEARALACRQANRGAQKVQDGEDQCGNHGDADDLLEAGDTAGDHGHRNRHGKALQKILDYACDQLSDRQVHLFLLKVRELFDKAFKLFGAGMVYRDGRTPRRVS